MGVAVVIIAGLFGAFAGSFLNVCIHRLPRNESISHPPSRCYACGTAIAWYDNLPVVSWFVLRGKCRHCGAPYSLRYVLAEVGVGLLFAGVAWWLWQVWQQPHPLVMPFAAVLQAMGWPGQEIGFGFMLAVLFAAVSMALVATVIDWQFTIIPDELTLPWLLLAPTLAVVTPTVVGLSISSDGLVTYPMLHWLPYLVIEQGWWSAGASWWRLCGYTLSGLALTWLAWPLARVAWRRYVDGWTPEDETGFVRAQWLWTTGLLVALAIAGVIAGLGGGEPAPFAQPDAAQQIYAVLFYHLGQGIFGAWLGWNVLFLISALGTYVFRNTPWAWATSSFWPLWARSLGRSVSL